MYFEKFMSSNKITRWYFTNISGLNLYEKQIEKRNIMFVGTRLGQTKLTVSCHFWLQKFNAKLGLSFKYLFYIDILKKKKKIPLWINDNALGKAPSPCCFYTLYAYTPCYILWFLLYQILAYLLCTNSPVSQWQCHGVCLISTLIPAIRSLIFWIN